MPPTKWTQDCKASDNGSDLSRRMRQYYIAMQTSLLNRLYSWQTDQSGGNSILLTTIPAHLSVLHWFSSVCNITISQFGCSSVCWQLTLTMISIYMSQTLIQARVYCLMQSGDWLQTWLRTANTSMPTCVSDEARNVSSFIYNSLESQIQRFILDCYWFIGGKIILVSKQFAFSALPIMISLLDSIE